MIEVVVRHSGLGGLLELRRDLLRLLRGVGRTNRRSLRLRRSGRLLPHRFRRRQGSPALPAMRNPRKVIRPAFRARYSYLALVHGNLLMRDV